MRPELAGSPYKRVTTRLMSVSTGVQALESMPGYRYAKFALTRASRPRAWAGWGRADWRALTRDLLQIDNRCDHEFAAVVTTLPGRPAPRNQSQDVVHEAKRSAVAYAPDHRIIVR